MRSTLTFGVASAFILAAAAGAFADIAYPTSTSLDPVAWGPNNMTTGLSYTGAGAVLSDDSKLRLDMHNGTTAYDFQLIFTFAGIPPGNEPRVVLDTVTVFPSASGEWKLMNLIWYAAATPTKTATYSYGGGITLADSSYRLADDFKTSFIAGGGFGASDWDLVNTLAVQFTFTNLGVGSTHYLDFDAISNPEPGTMALFGLGAMGLGGFAWRRRKARRGAKQTS